MLRGNQFIPIDSDQWIRSHKSTFFPPPSSSTLVMTVPALEESQRVQSGGNYRSPLAERHHPLLFNLLGQKRKSSQTVMRQDSMGQVNLSQQQLS